MFTLEALNGYPFTMTNEEYAGQRGYTGQRLSLGVYIPTLLAPGARG